VRKKQIEIGLLHQARERVKALLSHEILQGEQHVESKAGLEKIKSMLHPMQAIAKMYDYEPFPATIDQVDLGINWDSAQKGIISSGLGNFDEIDESTEGVERKEGKEAVFHSKSLFQTEVECNQSQPLRLEAIKNIRTAKDSGDRSENLIFSLMNPNAPESDDAHSYVGNLAFSRVDHPDHKEWDMNDRIVAEAYRNQGVAPKMLGMAEQMIKEHGKETGLPQAISAEVGQVSVLIWLLKQGYKPVSDQDQKRIDRLLGGDENLAIASAPDDKEALEKRQWFIFEKDKLLDTSGKQKPEVWNKDNYGKPEHYMKSSFRIHLKKEIK